MSDPFIALKTRLAGVYDLNKVGALLSWDESVTMPPGGAAARAEQTATVGRIAHELFVAPEVGRMLDDLGTYEQSLPYDSDDASLIRVTRCATTCTATGASSRRRRRCRR